MTNSTSTSRRVKSCAAGNGAEAGTRTGRGQAWSGSCRAMVRRAIAESATSVTRSFGIWAAPRSMSASRASALAYAGTSWPERAPTRRVAHRVGAPGQVGQDVGPRPAGQQRRLPQVRLGDHPGRAEQALRRIVDLVAELSLRGVHPPTLSSRPVRAVRGELRPPRHAGTIHRRRWIDDPAAGQD